MNHDVKSVNLALSGGGVKGIAYIGAFSAAEQRGYRFKNISGVSAGALVGALAGAGYTVPELWKVLNEFDFAKIKLEEIVKRVPVVASYIAFVGASRGYGRRDFEYFISRGFMNYRLLDPGEFPLGYRGNMLKNIVSFSKAGCLYDGDYLEEWVSRTLAARGIRTFGDLKGGIRDRVNPEGYRVRMTAVDANRGRIVVLPDDMAFYGVNPDSFEVAKAVRMSTCVPFAFKPVEIKRVQGSKIHTHYFIDGGVIDNFPFWLIDESQTINLLGFRLDGGEKKSIISILSPMNVLKGIISAVHDLGTPKNTHKLKYVGNIDASKVSFLDFDLSDGEKAYMYGQGFYSGHMLFDRFEKELSYGPML